MNRIAAMLVLALSPTLARTETPHEFVAELTSWGYTCSADRLKLEKSGMSEGLFINAINHAGTVRVDGVMLFQNLPISGSVTDAKVDEWIKTNDPKGTENYRVQIDHSVSIQMWAPKDRTAPRPPMRNELDEAWTRIAKLHDWLLKRPKTPVLEKLEDRVVTELDNYDVSYLVRHWNWPETGPGAGGSSAGWFVPAQPNGAQIYIFGVGASDSRHIMSALYITSTFALGKGWSPAKALENISEDEKWDVFGTNHLMSASTRIDLAKGMTLGQVKARILAFAADIKAKTSPLRPF